MDIRIVAYLQIERFRIVQLIRRLASTHRPRAGSHIRLASPTVSRSLAVWARFGTALRRFRTYTVCKVTASSFTTPCCRRQVLYPGSVFFLHFLGSHLLLVAYLSSTISLAYKYAPSGLVGGEATLARFPLLLALACFLSHPADKTTNPSAVPSNRLPVQ